MSEESGEPKSRKLKLSSSRSQPANQESATTAKPTFSATPTPEVNSRPKVALKTTSTDATPTPAAATPATNSAPPPLKEQAAPAQNTPPPLKQNTAPRSASPPLPSAGQVARPAPSPPPKDDPLGSLLIITGLLFILAAAAGGIWYLFQSDQSEPADDETTEAATEKVTYTNQIERAKATIESVPARSLDEVIDMSEPPTPEVVTTQATSNANSTTIADKTLNAEAAATAQAAADAAAARQALKETVSTYLQSVHIGGVRTGPRARIMLNGENYDINDIVDPTIGLKFIGTRDKKLLFKDPNGVTYVKSF